MREAYPRLIVTDTSGGSREVEISTPEFTIGRQSDSDLVLFESRRVAPRWIGTFSEAERG